ncbi:MAG: hypothetical protein BWX55_01096 [Deltaproteobacteria bacterium ADurb.Bin022]|nr:MAG: hypothetical protein BWX55_01096 [Deltaproteobacteria bacterium ADurb.Bin022]
MDFINHGRFADTGSTGNNHHGQSLVAVGYLLESGDQFRYFLFPSEKFLRNDEPVGYILSPQFKGFYPFFLFPLFQAFLKIGLKTETVLVSGLGVFGQQPHDDIRHHGRNTGIKLNGRPGHHGDMRMNEFHGVLRLERQQTGDDFIQSDSQRIEIRAVINRPVHPAGLLRRHVCQGIADEIRIIDFIMFVSQQSGYSEVRNFQFLRFRIDQKALGFYVPVNDSPGMQRCQCCGNVRR